MKAIADTGFLVAFGNRKDRYHEWARQLAERVTEPLPTCDAVLAETAFHLGSSELVLVTRLVELALRYADRKPDLADLCVIRLSELHPRHPDITTDPGDFRIYRRGRREAIPLVHPPSKEVGATSAAASA
jgi:hypothetical protein